MNREDVKNWMNWNRTGKIVLDLCGAVNRGHHAETQRRERVIYNYTNFSPVITLRPATVGMYSISENPVSPNISSISDIE